MANPLLAKPPLESKSKSAWQTFERTVTACERCPRLRRHCTHIATVRRKAYANETYWGRPITGFGDRDAGLVIIGLAPAAHGGNRTGRVFTGDRSGDWLYRALHKAGFANQPTSVRRDDGLKLIDAYITATVKCAPPDNKPTPEEIKRCLPYLDWELGALTGAQVYVALGKLAYDQAWSAFRRLGIIDQNATLVKRPDFGHNVVVKLPTPSAGKGPERWLIASYHPSQQNTFTGKLTEPMFDAVFRKAREFL